MRLLFSHYYLDTHSVLKKRTPPIDDQFGVYFITGRQGSGKTYHAVEFLHRQKTRSKIYTNIHSLKMQHIDFNKIEEIITNTENDCIFVIDEVSRKYDRNSRTDTQFYAWLNQSRKRRRIVVLITQEWRELPMWIRRPAKYMLSVKPTKFLRAFGYYTACWGDAENMVFDKDESEYVCPPIKYEISKRNKSIAQLYDTFEPINEL